MLQYGRECADQTAMLAGHKTLDARERFAQFLPPPAASSSNSESPSGQPQFALHDHEIAAYLGVSKQHFSSIKRRSAGVVR